VELFSIRTIEDIQNLVIAGFTDWQSLGHVTVREFDGLLVFNYNQMAQYAEEWNAFEVLSRGLIIDKQTGEIVARSFDKFFNWGERGIFTTAPIVNITEKLDGSLGILYRKNGEYRIATRGSLESEQALWATEYLNQNYKLDDLPIEYTLLFEIIYPANRVVVNYGERQDLVLLAARNRFMGHHLEYARVRALAHRYGFSLPYDGLYSYGMSIDELLTNIGLLGENEEGYVAEFADGQRFKFKGKQYLRLHKLLTRLSFKNMLAALEHGELGTFLEGIPDEFLGQAKVWIAEIEGTITSENARLRSIYETCPQSSRKDFALYVTANHKKDSRYLFALLDGKEIAPLIYKHHEWSRSDAKAIKEEG
jgi:RNA ligase